MPFCVKRIRHPQENDIGKDKFGALNPSRNRGGEEISQRNISHNEKGQTYYTYTADDNEKKLYLSIYPFHPTQLICPMFP